MKGQISLFDGTSLSKEAMAIKLIQEFEDKRSEKDKM